MSLIPRAAMSAAAIIFLFFSLELILRFAISAYPFRYEVSRDSGFVLDPELGFRIKNMKGFNSLGIKGAEISPKSEEFRVLLLGDSLFYSFDAALLEKKLSAYCPSIKINVINAGIPGYTTLQELDFLRLYGLSVQPDIVILGFVLNDLYEYLHRPSGDGTLSGMHPQARRAYLSKDGIAGGMLWRSYLAHFFKRALDLFYKRFINPPLYSFERRGDFHAAWKDFMWKDEAARLKAMRDMLDSEGIRFAVVCFPVREQFDEDFIKQDREYLLKPQLKLSEICKTYSIPLLDLWDYFYPKAGAGLFRDYHHLNPAGNALLADKLAEFINNKKMVARELKAFSRAK